MRTTTARRRRAAAVLAVLLLVAPACSADRSAPVDDLALPPVDPPAGHVQQVYGPLEPPPVGATGFGVLGVRTAPDGTTYVLDDPQRPSPGDDTRGSPRTAVLDLTTGTATPLDDYSVSGREVERPVVDAVGPDGSVYDVVDPYAEFPRLHVRPPDGVWREAGLPQEPCTFNRGPVVPGAEGAIYQVCGGEVRVRTAQDGERVVAGRPMLTGGRPPAVPVDTGPRPAIGASLPLLQSVLPAPDGRLYLLSADTVHLLDADGVLRLVAGPGTPAEPGAELRTDTPFVPGKDFYVVGDGTLLGGAALGKDGALYLSDAQDGRLLALGTDGRLRLLSRRPPQAGGSRAADDAGRRPVPVAAAVAYPSDLAVLPDGDLLIADDYRVLRLGAPG